MPAAGHSIFYCLVFCAGIMATLFAGHPAALNIPALVVFLLTSLFSFRLKSGRPLLALAAGFIWASHSIEENTSAQLKADLAGTEISLMGTIASIPDVDEGSTKFLFRPHGQDDSLPQLMQMRWYRNAPLLRANQLWRFKVRVLPPRGRLNFSGFDFEKWLFARSIGATGSVRSGELVAEYSSAANSVLALRQNISSRISVILTGHPAQGLVKALAVGDRAGINPEQWQFLAASGTSHLVAISGMHIGMIALFGFLVGKGLFRLIPNQLVATGSKRLGIIFALAFAAAYALLSGFVVPAQRALLLLMVILSGTLLRRRAGTFYSLVLAMTGVLLIDALAPLRTGFWLSFSAVGYLLYAATGSTVEQNKFKQMFRAQWVVILGFKDCIK